MNLYAIVTACALCGAVHAQPFGSLVEWTALAGDEAHTASRQTSIGPFGAPRWVRSQTLSGQAIRFNGPAGLAATVLPVPRIFATAVIAGQTVAISIDAETGAVAWTTPIPALVYNSWSAPALHPESGVVLYAAGTSLIALRMSDGVQMWTTALDEPPVNVSPLVTRGLTMRNRAFVTDYGGFGGPSSLYCINVSPRHPTINPYDPGQLVWRAPIGSSTGATPACLDGIVYVCSTGLDGAGFGEIRAFDARATTEPEPLWVFTNPILEGFFGGLCIRETPTDTFLYAATYAFYGELDSSNLVKVHARSGDLVWSVACNRTESIPIVLDDGRVVLSTGIHGFGSLPTVQMFQDHGPSATLVWDTATSTWQDHNNNGFIDLGEFFLVGGRTTHPVLAYSSDKSRSPRLLVGSIPTGGDLFGPYTNLYELDLDQSPADAGFIVQQSTAAGSSPALLGKGVYSVGTGGLAAFGPPPPRPDVHADRRIDIEDLYAWEQGQGFRDIDRSGVVNSLDRDFLLFELRRNEDRGGARR